MCSTFHLFLQSLGLLCAHRASEFHPRYGRRTLRVVSSRFEPTMVQSSTAQAARGSSPCRGDALNRAKVLEDRLAWMILVGENSVPRRRGSRRVLRSSAVLSSFIDRVSSSSGKTMEDFPERGNRRGCHGRWERRSSPPADEGHGRWCSTGKREVPGGAETLL